MSLLMEALKKAEAAKLANPAVSASASQNTVAEAGFEQPQITTTTDNATEPVETEEEIEIAEEVNAWQQQLLAETTERAAFILEETQQIEIVSSEDESSVLVEMLHDEKNHEVNWEAEILPEFQETLATETTTELTQPVVLEDNHSNIHWEEEPTVNLESESLESSHPAPTLNFLRDIAPDLSLEQLHQETPPILKLDWDDELLANETAAVTVPTLPKIEKLTFPDLPPNTFSSNDTPKSPKIEESEHFSKHKQEQQQRESAKQLFKASSRSSSYRGAYIALVFVVFIGIIGFYGQYRESGQSWFEMLNQQFMGETFVANVPKTLPPTLPPATHPIESMGKTPAATPVAAQPVPAKAPVENQPVAMPASPLQNAALPKTLPTTSQPAETQSSELTGKSMSAQAVTEAKLRPPATIPVVPPTELKTEKVANSRRSKAEMSKSSETAISTTQLQKNQEIQITRSTLAPRIHQRLNEAYAALQRGENTQALVAYQAVLQQESRNRDALLGLAALAVRQHNLTQAVRYYQEILKYHPQDPVAKANLLSISEQSGEDQENQLKTLARTTQQPAYIQFQLGVMYAQQNRWQEAQQAFFEAYRLDQQQADYAYNLAVSLEQLGQPRVAVNYYQRAVELQQKQRKSYSFVARQVQQRIAELQPLVK